MNEFIAYMNREERRIPSILAANEPMIELTTDERVKHEYTTACVLCKRTFGGSARIKTTHHCNVTGRYIAIVCHLCKLHLNYRRSSSEVFSFRVFFATTITSAATAAAAAAAAVASSATTVK